MSRSQAAIRMADGKAAQAAASRQAPAPALEAVKAEEVTQPPPSPAAPEAAEPVFPKVTITVPLGDEAPVGYVSPRIDMSMGSREAAAFHRVFTGLKESGARLSSGNYVNTRSDAVKWIMEQVAAQSEALVVQNVTSGGGGSGK